MPGMRRSKGQKGFHRVPVMCFLTRQHHWFPFSLNFGRQQRQWCLHTEDECLFGTSPSSVPWWLHKYFCPCLLMAFSWGKLLPVLYLLQQARYIFYGPHVGAGPLSKAGKEGWHGAMIKWDPSTEHILKHKPVRDAQLAMRSNHQAGLWLIRSAVRTGVCASESSAVGCTRKWEKGSSHLAEETRGRTSRLQPQHAVSCCCPASGLRLWAPLPGGSGNGAFCPRDGWGEQIPASCDELVPLGSRLRAGTPQHPRDAEGTDSASLSEMKVNLGVLDGSQSTIWVSSSIFKISWCDQMSSMCFQSVPPSQQFRVQP